MDEGPSQMVKLARRVSPRPLLLGSLLLPTCVEQTLKPFLQFIRGDGQEESIKLVYK